MWLRSRLSAKRSSRHKIFTVLRDVYPALYIGGASKPRERMRVEIGGRGNEGVANSVWSNPKEIRIPDEVVRMRFPVVRVGKKDADVMQQRRHIRAVRVPTGRNHAGPTRRQQLSNSSERQTRDMQCMRAFVESTRASQLEHASFSGNEACSKRNLGHVTREIVDRQPLHAGHGR